MSAFGTKRTSELTPPMSAFGVKRTSQIRPVMSAFDPKRTSSDLTLCPFRSTATDWYDAPVLSRRAAMRRRDFIKVFSGAAVAWPLAVRAQQAGKLPTIGFVGVDSTIWSPLTAAFVGRLRELGWIED